VRKKDLDFENSGEERGKGSRVGFRRRGRNANEMTKQEEIENERVEAGEWKGWWNVVNSRAGKSLATEREEENVWNGSEEENATWKIRVLSRGRVTDREEER